MPQRCSSREPSEHLLMAAVSFIEETLENASSIRRGPPSESAYRQRLGHDSDSPPLAPFASVLDSEETLSFVDRPLDSEAQKIEGVTELPPVVGEVGMADALADEKMRTVIGATVARLLGLVVRLVCLHCAVRVQCDRFSCPVGFCGLSRLIALRTLSKRRSGAYFRQKRSRPVVSSL